MESTLNWRPDCTEQTRNKCREVTTVNAQDLVRRLRNAETVFRDDGQHAHVGRLCLLELQQEERVRKCKEQRTYFHEAFT